jgi:hypothetical protein
MAGRADSKAGRHRNESDLARASIAAGYAMAAETPLDAPREIVRPWLRIDAYLRYLAWLANRPIAPILRQQ